jgi:phosphoribosylglycinamide formyltransferase-1
VTGGQPARLAILISGRGSNRQAFIDACASGELPATVVLVISNNPDAAGLRRAAEAGIATACIDHREFPDRESFDRALVAEVEARKPDLVILAGFMRILTSVFITPFAGRLLNIHPSLLPKYRGLHTHQRALDAGDSHAGATVHYVTAELDGGPSIIQAREPILPGDTAETLAARVVALEHAIYRIAARWHIQGRLRLTEQGVFLDDKPIPATGIQYETGLR